MKKHFCLLLILGVLSGCNFQQQHNAALLDELHFLFENKEIFKGSRLFEKQKHKLTELDRLIFAARIENAFNKPEQSNQHITALFDNYIAELPDSLECEILKLELQNHIKLYDYKMAVEVTNKLFEDYTDELDSLTVTKLNNELNIWEGLKNMPPQHLVRKDYTHIDLVDGMKIPTSLNKHKHKINLLFDTGANISVIIESQAKAKNLQFTGAICKVKGILGNNIESKIAVATTMEFGNIELNNVVFLVFPDEALYVPEADFQIYGIIGYPVMSALGEIQITRDKKLIIPEKYSSHSYSNLAMDFLTPITEIISAGDSLACIFDTGANSTWLLGKYYSKHKIEIDSLYSSSRITVGGVGKIEEYKGYYIEFNLEIGNQVLEMDSVFLLPQTDINNGENYYANIGQDIVQSFDKMTINFDDMFLLFSNN